MKNEYDFSQAEQGKFYRPDANFVYPIYLEPDVSSFFSRVAAEKNIDVQVLVNEWLRNNIQVIQSVQ